MTSSDDVRDLVFLDSVTYRDNSIFKLWSMNIEFNLLLDNYEQDGCWYNDTLYDVSPGQMYLSHNVIKVFSQDKQFVCYAVLANENKAADVASPPKPMYFFKESRGEKEFLYKQFRLSQDEAYIFQFNEKKYALNANGDVEEIQVNESIEEMQIEAPVLVEEEEKSTGCFPSFRGFFKKHKSSASSSFSSSSELELEGYSSSRSSPSLSGFDKR